jgi:hypothetical protein
MTKNEILDIIESQTLMKATSIQEDKECEINALRRQWDLLKGYYTLKFDPTSLEVLEVMDHIENGTFKPEQIDKPSEINHNIITTSDKEISNIGIISRTSRGFEIITFNDFNNIVCSLQQSSIIGDNLNSYSNPGSSCVWLGTGEDRMHLDRKMVIKLIMYLDNWLKTGSFESPKL